MPVIWRFEVANALQMAVRRKRVDAEFRDRALTHLGSLNIATDLDSESQAWRATVRLAEQYGLTVYDAAYLELAHRQRIALATLDSALARAATAQRVAVIGSQR